MRATVKHYTTWLQAADECKALGLTLEVIASCSWYTIRNAHGKTVAAATSLDEVMAQVQEVAA